MEEETTTTAPASDTGVSTDDTQPVPAEPAEAVQEATDVTTQDAPQGDEPTESATPTEDNSTTEWLKKKGVDPNSPEAIEKVAEMARNAEKAMHQKGQQVSELQKSVEKVADDEVTQYEEASGEVVSETDRVVRKLVVKDNVRTFFDENPDAKQFEQEMIAELGRKPHLAGDLESLYANAVVNSGKIEAVKSQGKREALESLAANQTAAVPRGNAVTSVQSPAQITPQNVDELVGKNDLAWFQKNKAAIDKAMAG